MKSCSEATNSPIQHCPFEYIIQVFSADGLLLSECLVDARRHKIADIEGAVRYAADTPAIARFGTSVVFVGNEVLD